MSNIHFQFVLCGDYIYFFLLEQKQLKLHSQKINLWKRNIIATKTCHIGLSELG